MARWKKIIIAGLFIAVAGGLYGWYLYSKKPQNIIQASSQFEITAAGLVTDFNNDETAATKKYVDKVITVKGTITDVKVEPTGSATVFLDSSDPMAAVTCSFYKSEVKAVKDLKTGTPIKIKGVCTGKLIDVVFNKCSIVQ